MLESKSNSKNDRPTGFHLVHMKKRKCQNLNSNPTQTWTDQPGQQILHPKEAKLSFCTSSVVGGRQQSVILRKIRQCLNLQQNPQIQSKSNVQATHSALYLSQFLASLARRSEHKFPSRSAEESTLIYNYDVFFTGGFPSSMKTPLQQSMLHRQIPLSVLAQLLNQFLF